MSMPILCRCLCYVDVYDMSMSMSVFLQVLECLKQAMQPALTDLELEFDTPAGVTCMTIPPTIPANVFDEEKLALFVLFVGEVRELLYLLTVHTYCTYRLIIY